MLRTFTIFVARDGDSFVEDVDATDEIAACAMAVERVNQAWRTNYPDWDELGSDSDACTLDAHPAVMAERIPLDTMQRYRELADETRALLNAFGGDTPNWLREETWRIEALLDQLEQDDPGDRVIREVAKCGDWVSELFKPLPAEEAAILSQMIVSGRELHNGVTNHYRCTSCGTEWSDTWSCACDDRCECGTVMTPCASDYGDAPTGDA